MSFSQARGFLVTESSFNEVHGDYNHQETTSNPQSISIGYSSETSPPASPPPPYHHISTSVAASPVASYGSNVGGNQINHVHNYYTIAGSYSSNPSSPVPLSVHAARAPQPQVDISSILDNEVKRRGQELNWRQSVVDILKLLNLDSAPEARKRLAKAVGYNGDTAEVSTKMNIWLRRYIQNAIDSVGGDLAAARRILLTQLPQVDISVILDNEVKRRGDELNWQQSVVDILKLVNLDSAPEARKRLAKAAGYDGDTAEVSTKMNIWLRRYVQNVIGSVGGDLAAARRILLQKVL
ncbi:hypothetical protein APHAL10511_000428 [Amanita phalloides]|nr:hypothetical protein APHAL10511_000428 [Amanita phalloides]